MKSKQLFLSTFLGILSFHAMEFSESDPNIAYVGMGEPQMRNNVSWGDGDYKTTDDGRS